MKIEKAIEILELLASGQDCRIDQEYLEPIRLGIEALKRIRDGRAGEYDYFGHLLPGETKD